MKNEIWFETVGRKHFRSFAVLLAKAISLAKQNGIEPWELDMDTLLRMYREEAPKLSDEQVRKAKRLHQKGISITKLAERYGVSYGTMHHIIKGYYRRNVF